MQNDKKEHSGDCVGDSSFFLRGKGQNDQFDPCGGMPLVGVRTLKVLYLHTQEY